VVKHYNKIKRQNAVYTHHTIRLLNMSADKVLPFYFVIASLMSWSPMIRLKKKYTTNHTWKWFYTLVSEQQVFEQTLPKFNMFHLEPTPSSLRWNAAFIIKITKRLIALKNYVRELCGGHRVPPIENSLCKEQAGQPDESHRLPDKQHS
jgi:hypothetical protein